MSGGLKAPHFIMFILFCILVIGINLAPFFFQFLDIWTAQQLWAQCGIGLMFSYSFIKPQVYISKPNIPLGVLHAWVAALTAVLCFIALGNGKHDIFHFLPYFNFLCLLGLYLLITKYIMPFQIVQCLNIFRYVVIGTLLLCALQFFGIAQFFQLFNPGAKFDSNPVMGMLGNGTHLSGFLAMLSPVFMWRLNRTDILALILMVIILCFSGSSISDPSVSGFVILPALWLFMMKNRKKVFWASVIALMLAALVFLHYVPENFFGTNGRSGVWLIYWGFFKQLPITGAGLGTVELIFREHPEISPFTHLHMEYFQFTFELGLIGISLIGWMILDFIQVESIRREQLVCKAIVIGFLLSCCFNYPAHLWLPSTYAMIAYASFMALRGRVKC